MRKTPRARSRSRCIARLSARSLWQPIQPVGREFALDGRAVCGIDSVACLSFLLRLPPCASSSPFCLPSCCRCKRWPGWPCRGRWLRRRRARRLARTARPMLWLLPATRSSTTRRPRPAKRRASIARSVTWRAPACCPRRRESRPVGRGSRSWLSAVKRNPLHTCRKSPTHRLSPFASDSEGSSRLSPGLIAAGTRCESPGRPTVGWSATTR